MMKRSQTVLSVVLCLLPIVLGIILWDKLPQQMAIHFDTTGNPDNYASKALVVVGLPVFLAAVDALAIFTTNRDPKRERQPEVIRRLVFWICPVICNVAMPVTLFIALGKDIPIGMIIGSLVGVMIVIAGNYLPKCKQNYTIGIKLPWTLQNEDNWNYTHRTAGFVWVAAGILMIANAFLKIPYVTLSLVFIMVAFPFIGSYRYYLKHQ